MNVLCKELEINLRWYFRQEYRNSSIVDDLCQESYFRLLKSINLVNDPLKLSGFVAKIALHVAQEHERSNYRQYKKRLTLDSSLELLHRQIFASLIEDENSIDPHEDSIGCRIDLEIGLSKLSEESRKILLLKAQGYEYQEIANLVGLSVGAIKMRVKRGLETLSSLLSSNNQSKPKIGQSDQN